MSNPLFDTLFRPTTVPPQVASAAPVRVKGTHSRAGNAMSRTRAALLSGAALAVAEAGTKITMAGVAQSSGVAKATLYNHFRTREAVLAALVIDQITAVVDAQRDKPLEVALVDAATMLAQHPVLRGLARVEPAVLARLARIDDSAAGWLLARTAVMEAVTRAGRGGAGTVLRWLASYLLSPAETADIAADVAVLVAGLPVVDSITAPPAPPIARPA